MFKEKGAHGGVFKDLQFGKAFGMEMVEPVWDDDSWFRGHGLLLVCSSGFNGKNLMQNLCLFPEVIKKMARLKCPKDKALKLINKTN